MVWWRLIFCFMLSNIFIQNNGATSYDWAIIGAGPAGIIVVGLLIDLGVPVKQIVWIDPQFNVGKLSSYPEVPANSTIKSFIDFLQSCKTFASCKTAAIESIYSYHPYSEPPLEVIVHVLNDITEYLRSQIDCHKGFLTSLDYSGEHWRIGVTGQVALNAERVILATGSHPKSLHYACDQIIPLDIALNKSKLAACVKETDSFAIVGGSHSAILVMKFLSELSVARIINFYNKPLQYAIDMGNWVLHNATGLKGVAAEWAHTVLEKNPPANLIRIFNTDASLKAWLPVCNKIIYAIGYEPNTIPPINGSTAIPQYDNTTGIIAPHLFGIGIAFPEYTIDPNGNGEHQVGLNSFMEYAQRILPHWSQKSVLEKNMENINHFKKFDSLFDIVML